MRRQFPETNLDRRRVLPMPDSTLGGCSSMVEHELPKLDTSVRF
jgi:hypothetical protein